MHHRIHNFEDIQRESRNLLYKLSLYVDDNKNYLSKIDSFRNCLTSDIQKRIFDIFCLHLFKSERSAPGGADLFLDFVLEKSSNLENTKIFQKKDLKDIINSFSEGDVRNLILDICSLVDFKSKVIIKDEISKSSKSVIEKNSSFYFENLFSSFLLSQRKIPNARICPIDGYIESISEIHHILEKTSHSKEPLLLFVRGISEDVVNTLKVNYARGTLVAIPIVVQFDLDGANLLNDIAVVSGCDVVSSFKGEILSAIDLTRFPRVDLTSFLSSGISIENKGTTSSIERHVSFLKDKIRNSSSSIEEESLTKRIQRFSSDQVTISLSEDHKKSQIQIDRTLRAIQSSKDFGIATYKKRTIPVSTFESGKFYAEKFCKAILEIGCFIS